MKAQHVSSGIPLIIRSSKLYLPLETCWAFNKPWNNKFCYKFASCWLFQLIHTTMHGSMSIKVNTLFIRKVPASFVNRMIGYASLKYLHVVQDKKWNNLPLDWIQCVCVYVFCRSRWGPGVRHNTTLKARCTRYTQYRHHDRKRETRTITIPGLELAQRRGLQWLNICIQSSGLSAVQHTSNKHCLSWSYSK